MYAELRQALARCRRVLVTTHIMPDGDALGSSLALRTGLERMGIESEIQLSGPVPPRFSFLDPGGRLRVFDANAGIGDGFDAFLVVDTSEVERIGAIAKAVPSGMMRLCIDHHATTAPFADVAVMCLEATAAAELVHDFLTEEMGIALDLELAFPIYVALYTETGGFCFSNTTAKTLRLAARCVELGVEPPLVHRNINERRQLSTLRLMARALERTRHEADGRLAWTALGPDDFRQTRTTAEDTSRLIDYPRSLEGVEIAILLFEDEPGSTKISFRSQGALDVGTLAARFGGGGHRSASGAKLNLPIDRACEVVVGAARETIRGNV